MMELQAHPKGIKKGSRCNPYTFPVSRISRQHFFDNFQSKQILPLPWGNGQTWSASNNKQLTRKQIDNNHDSGKHASDIISSQQTQPATKKIKPFVAAAAFPDDIPRFVEVEFAAFQDETVNHVLSYRDPSNPEHAARTIDFYTHCMQHMRTCALPGQPIDTKRIRTDSKLDLTLVSEGDANVEGYRFRKVLDPQTNEIIAFAKSEITTLTPEDHASPLDIGHETESQMNRDWFALNERLHRTYCGLRQHLYFGMLATHPSHQHRGAATSLMSELIAEADALGLEIYCEATRTGRPMYEKYGFVPVHTLTFDPAEYGLTGLGVEVQTVMVRGALGDDGVRKPVKMMEEMEV